MCFCWLWMPGYILIIPKLWPNTTDIYSIITAHDENISRKCTCFSNAIMPNGQRFCLHIYLQHAHTIDYLINASRLTSINALLRALCGAGFRWSWVDFVVAYWFIVTRDTQKSESHHSGRVTGESCRDTPRRYEHGRAHREPPAVMPLCPPSIISVSPHNDLV